MTLLLLGARIVLWTSTILIAVDFVRLDRAIDKHYPPDLPDTRRTNETLDEEGKAMLPAYYGRILAVMIGVGLIMLLEKAVRG